MVSVEGEHSRSLTFAQLWTRSEELAAVLQHAGIGSGDRVVVQLPNSLMIPVVLFALWRLGAVPVLALPRHGHHEVGHIVSESGAQAIICVDRWKRTDMLTVARKAARGGRAQVLVVGGSGRLDPGEVDLDAAACPGLLPPLPAARPSDLAVLLLSGGSTGMPKLIPRTHDDYTYNARLSAQLCGLDQSSVYLVALPAAHNFPLACPGLLGTLMAGGTTVLVDSTAAAAMMRAGRDHCATVTALVPTVAVLWAAEAEATGRRVPSLRLLQVGGAPLRANVARRLHASLGCPIQQVYGMAEGLLNFTRLDDPPEVTFTTQGRPASPGDEIRIVDPSGADVLPGEKGELWTRGPYTIVSYYGRPPSDETFSPDGFYRTGDLVRQDQSGNLVVEGRIKDVINLSGENVSAGEVEQLLAQHPGISEVAVVGREAGAGNEHVCAVVVMSPGLAVTLDSMRRFLHDLGVARFKFPSSLFVVNKLPLTPLGKPDKATLRRSIAGMGPHLAAETHEASEPCR